MAEETVDRCVQTANLQQKNGCVTKGLILSGGEKWTPTSYIRLVQDYGIETEVSARLEWSSARLRSSLVYRAGRRASFQYLWR